MQLDYKDIIIKHYALSMSGSEIARQTGFSKSGVNDFLRAFKRCEDLSYPLPAGITNYGIALKVYGSVPGSGARNENIELSANSIMKRATKHYTIKINTR